MLWIGTSGWQYRHWRETFYPRGLAQTKWLEFYADRFDTVESNAAFYRLPEAATFAAWAEREPGGVNEGGLALEIAPSLPLALG